MWPAFQIVKAALRFRDYKPQPVTLASANRWVRQFNKPDQKHVCQLLENVVYLSEKTTTQILLEQNGAIHKRLFAAGLKPKELIYVTIDEPGSSSGVMLSILRDRFGLEQMGCKFLDSKNSMEINEVTNRLGKGAIIYVDDFVGTGDQFCKARDFAVQSVVGTFSEFLLVPSVCEEALYKLGERGVEAFTGHLHSKVDRPLHANSSILSGSAKTRLVEICREISPKMGLGYDDMATMVILYRNAPNNVPAILRGSPQCARYHGLFPRFKDLPPMKV
jgi:hypothetical protein